MRGDPGRRVTREAVDLAPTPVPTPAMGASMTFVQATLLRFSWQLPSVFRVGVSKAFKRFLGSLPGKLVSLSAWVVIRAIVELNTVPSARLKPTSRPYFSSHR